MATLARAAAALLVAAVAARAEPLPLAVSPVTLQVEDRPVERIGALRYLGGIELRSGVGRFGGLSGLAVSPDGRSLSFVTDKGDWVRATPRYDAAGRLVGIAAAEIGRLLRPEGVPITRRTFSDAESLSRVEGGLAVAFEHRPRIWIYRGDGNPFLSAPRGFRTPDELKRAHRNRGPEAFAVLRDGLFVVLAEDFPEGAPHTRGWIHDGRAWRGFDYRRSGPYRPTGAAALPDGDLLVLERRFSLFGGLASRIVRVPRASLRPGAKVEGQELALLGPPMIGENFEGIDARRDEAGRTLVYLVSDDNFNPFQQTLLLLFALEP